MVENENNNDWKNDAEDLDLFRGIGEGSQADRMLQYGNVNKVLNVKLARLILAAKAWDMANPEMPLLSGLCNAAEKANMSVDAMARKDFMRVAIEQWQGKINAKKNNLSVMS